MSNSLQLLIPNSQSFKAKIFKGLFIRPAEGVGEICIHNRVQGGTGRQREAFAGKTSQEQGLSQLDKQLPKEEVYKTA